MAETASDPDELPEPDDAVQTHIPTRDPDDEVTTLAATLVEIDEMDTTSAGQYRELLLTTGSPLGFADWDAPFEIQSSDDGILQRTIVPGDGEAIAYFLHGLESHGIAEDAAIEFLETDLPEYYDAYRQFQAALTPRKRRFRLLDLLEHRIDPGGDWAAARYFDEGTPYPGRFRNTGLSESAERLAADIARQIEPRPHLCYWTAQKAALLHEANHRVAYVEGIALPTTAGQAIRHAWLEIDGAVAELTWPWHQYDGREAVYFGYEFPIEEVREARERRHLNGALALSDEEIREVSGVPAGERDD